MKRKHKPWEYARRIVGGVWDHPANADHRVRAVARSLGWQVRKRVWPKPVDVDYEGLLLRCYPDSNSASNVFYFTSRYDWDEMAFLDAYLRPGDGILDIGANIGTYSLFAAARCGLDARIDAFEPLPLAADRVRENFELNHLTNAFVHQVAVDDRPGTVEFIDSDVSSTVNENDSSASRFDVITVPVERIDALATGTGYAVAKLDVEGLELRALQGATRLLEAADPPVWQIELMDNVLAKKGTTPAAVVELLRDAGFSPAWYSAADRHLLFEDIADHEGFGSVHDPNVFFVADARRDEVLDRIGQARG